MWFTAPYTSSPFCQCEESDSAYPHPIPIIPISSFCWLYAPQNSSVQSAVRAPTHTHTHSLFYPYLFACVRVCVCIWIFLGAHKSTYEHTSTHHTHTQERLWRLQPRTPAKKKGVLIQKTMAWMFAFDMRVLFFA